MERVTNVFCGGGGGGGVAYTSLPNANNANTTPEKPSRSVSTPAPGTQNKAFNNGTIGNRVRISRPNRSKNVPLASGGTGGYLPPSTWEQLMQDDHFLGRFFLYFNATERRILAQVIQPFSSLFRLCYPYR